MPRISFESPNGAPGILHVPHAKQKVLIVRVGDFVRQNAGSILTFKDLRSIAGGQNGLLAQCSGTGSGVSPTRIGAAFRKYGGKPTVDAVEATVPFREKLKAMEIDPDIVTILENAAEQTLLDKQNERGKWGRLHSGSLRGQGDAFHEFLSKACRLPPLSREDEIKLALFIERCREDWRDVVLESPAVQDRAFLVLQRFALQPGGSHPFNWINTKERKQEKYEIAHGAVRRWGEMDPAERMHTLRSVDFTIRWLSKQQHALEKLQSGMVDKRLSHDRQEHLLRIAAEDPQALHDRIVLAKEREQEWVRAKDHMAMRNTRLVVSIAMRYKCRGLPHMDLIQQGNQGLLLAMDRYDVGRGCKFSTYATWWIQQSIRRALHEQPRIVRMKNPEARRRIYHADERFLKQHEREATDEELARTAHVDIEEVQSYRHRVVSLDVPVGEDGDDVLGDFVLEDHRESQAQEQVDMHALHAQITKVLNMLTYRERCILQLRLGLGDGNPYTLEECGRVLRVTRERIRQIETSAYKKLRDPRRARHLAPFVRDFLLQEEDKEKENVEKEKES